MDVREETRIATKLVKALQRREIDRREFLQLTGALSGIAVLAAACSPFASSTSSSGTATGTKVVPLWTSETDPDSQKFYATAIALWQQDHPDVQIKITFASDTSRIAFNAAIQSGTDLGILVPNITDVTDLINAKLLLPVTDIVNEIGKDDFEPGTRVIQGGQDYAIPYQFNSLLLEYRTDLFQAAGLPAPTTYENMLGAAIELNGKNGIAGYDVLMGNGQQQAVFTLSPFVYQSGWDYYSRDGSVTFGQPEVLDGVKRVVALLQHTSVAMYTASYQDVYGFWLAGRAAMTNFAGKLVYLTYQNSPKVEEGMDVVPLPAGPFMTGAIHNGSIGVYSLYARVKHATEAMAFLKYMTTGVNALAFSLTVPGHLLPPLKSVQKQLADPSNPLVAANPYMQKHARWVNLFVKYAASAIAPNVQMGAVNNHQFLGKANNTCPWAGQVWSGAAPVDAQMLQQILINKKDTEQAWMDATKMLTQIAQTWKSQNPTWKPTA